MALLILEQRHDMESMNTGLLRAAKKMESEMSENTIKASLALFVNEFGTTTAINVSDDGTCWADTHNKYIRISHNLEVEFPAMDSGEVTKAKLQALDEQEKQARDELSAQLYGIHWQRNELAEGGK